MDLTEDALAAALLEKLDGAGTLSADAQFFVYAAFEGARALADALRSDDRELPAVQDLVDPDGAHEPVGAYLRTVTVSGFRGVGPERTFSLKPGPGLTVMCGRNGSGKSSFAEAIEIALTGDNQRWAEGRAAEWRDGWRNLHGGQPPRIDVGLVIEGRTPASTTVRRRWPHAGDLTSAVTEVQAKGQPVASLASLGWTQALETYRPFLTYNELGGALTGKPSALHDALWQILGLDRISDTQKRLADATKPFKDAAEAVKSQSAVLLARAREVADERAIALAGLLSKRTWDLAAIQELAFDDGQDDSSSIGVLRQLAAVKGPALERVASVAEALRAGALRMAELAGTNAERSARDADLLEQAVSHHTAAGDGDCPVCGEGRLDQAWHDDAVRRISELRTEASEATAARRGLLEAHGEARHLLVAKPIVLERIIEAGLHLSADPAALWDAFVATPADPGQLAAHLELHAPGIAAAVDELVAKAQDELTGRENLWRPIVSQIQAWLAIAQQAKQDAATLAGLNAATKWVKETASDWANARLAPLAKESAQIWELLRMESNVVLGPVTLEGTGNRRRVRVDVAVDGAGGSAIGVMSQGELHSLAISLFLPRATVAASPFRFLVIDDPVQAMDPAKVDGLADVLASVATRRQVIVFTHDDRLPGAVRRKRIPATILEVTRRAGSVVDLVASEDPALRHLRDADSLMKDPAVDAAVASRVVPGLCRLAIDSACVDRIRAVRLGSGTKHTVVEQLIEANPKLYPRMALALFDAENRTGDVLTKLNGYGSWAANAFKACNKGAHEPMPFSQLDELIFSTRKLVRELQK